MSTRIPALPPVIRGAGNLPAPPLQNQLGEELGQVTRRSAECAADFDAARRIREACHDAAAREFPVGVCFVFTARSTCASVVDSRQCDFECDRHSTVVGHIFPDEVP